MDVLIVAHFAGELSPKTNSRFSYIAEMLVERGHKVELVTSDFSHGLKAKREPLSIELPYRVTMIEEPPYAKNVSIKRILSHSRMAHNLYKYLRDRPKPDVIYCAVPSLSVAYAAARYARSNNVRFIIDVQDIWPEAFEMVFHVPPISNIIFAPMRMRAKSIYASADEIIAVSETYAHLAKKANRKGAKAHSVFLGTDLAAFDSYAALADAKDKAEGEIWLAYVGTLGHSYDIPVVIDALKLLAEKGVSDIKFIVMGAGPLEESFKEYARSRGVHAEFTGRLGYEGMAARLSVCDIAVNPIRGRSAASIINKHADYAAAGIPVVNTQECLEYRKLLDKYNAGLNARNGDAADLAEKLLILADDVELRAIMGAKHRRMAEDLFDRARTYTQIMKIIEQQ